MTRMIRLTQVDTRANRGSVAREIEELGEDDGHEASVSGEPTRGVDVNPSFIRSMTDRRNASSGATQAGTRLTFMDGGGFSVTESREAIREMLGIRMIALTQVDSRASRSRGYDDDGYGSEAPASEETTREVEVNPNYIRSMTERRQSPGTRLTFSDGGGFSVTEGRDLIASAANPS